MVYNEVDSGARYDHQCYINTQKQTQIHIIFHFVEYSSVVWQQSNKQGNRIWVRHFFIFFFFAAFCLFVCLFVWCWPKRKIHHCSIINFTQLLANYFVLLPQVYKFSVLLTFRMGYFLLAAPPHNNTVCNRPSTLRLRVVCFSQTHCHYRRGTYTDGACEKRGPLCCTGLSQDFHRIAIHEMIFPNFRHLLIIHPFVRTKTANAHTRKWKEKEKNKITKMSLAKKEKKPRPIWHAFKWKKWWNVSLYVPQTSIFISYLPNFSKYFLLITKRPPAIIGVSMAVVGSLCRWARSSMLRYSHLNTCRDGNVIKMTFDSFSFKSMSIEGQTLALSYQIPIETTT